MEVFTSRHTEGGSHHLSVDGLYAFAPVSSNVSPLCGCMNMLPWQVNIMVITHDVASEGVVPECSPNSPNEGTPPVSPVVFDEAEQVGEEQEIMESWDD